MVTFHDAQVVDAHEALPDDLVSKSAPSLGLGGVLRLVLGAENTFKIIKKFIRRYDTVIPGYRHFNADLINAIFPTTRGTF